MHEGRKYIDDTSTIPVSLTVQPKHDGKRIDAYLCQRFPDYSRTFFSNLIKEKKVTNKQIINPNNEICKIIEIQYGDEVRESDIERLYYFDEKNPKPRY